MRESGSPLCSDLATRETMIVKISPPSPTSSTEAAAKGTNDWETVRVLGEGSFAVVKLAINVKTKEAVAVKYIDKVGANEDMTKKEIAIHKILKHSNIVQFYNYRREGESYFIFLEYIGGGELFDYIKPNVGMKVDQAKKFMLQLVKALKYLHSIGVVHRDVKPENCLISHNKCLKLSDFGFATIFRYKGKQRMLDKRCGTYPYMAPEVFSESVYLAEPIDIWSAGVTFAAMLTGQLLWPKPSMECDNFRAYVIKSYKFKQPWVSLSYELRKEVTEILKVNPRDRITLVEIEKSLEEFAASTSNKENNISASALGIQAFKILILKENFEIDANISKEIPQTDSKKSKSSNRPTIFSQPSSNVGMNHYEDDLTIDINIDSTFNSFSQPSKALLLDHNNADKNQIIMEDVLMSQITQNIESNELNKGFESFVHRMTRLFFANDTKTVTRALLKVLSSLNIHIHTHINNSIRASKISNINGEVKFSVTLMRTQKDILLCEFRRISGDGFDFKNMFREIQAIFESISHSKDS